MFANLLLSAEKEVPLIDMDGTIFLQFGIFLLLALVLYLLVFKPYFAIRKQRDAQTAGARERAHEMENQAALLASKLEARLKAAREKVADERQQLIKEATASEEAMLTEARGTSERGLAEARTALTNERERARVQMLTEVEPLAHEVASRVLGREL